MSGSYANFGVQAVVDVYPYEGGNYTLTSANGYMLGVSTTKSIAGPGSFTLTLSPGGVTGNSSQTWTQIITPLSLVVIAMMRGNYKQIVMLGVVTNITETQQWSEGAQRQTLVSGMDLTYFFAQTNYYNLTFLYGDAVAAAGGVGMLAASDNGLITGTPASIGSKWYNDIMAGTQGILSTTKFNIGNTTYPFKNIFGTLFQEMDTPVAIPTAANYLADQGNWLGKFQSFFQYPWYEFFINTAVPGYYGETQAANSITSSSSQFSPVSATIVARINPLPKLVNSGSLASPSWSVDVSNWNNLNSNLLDNVSFFSSSVTFSASEVRNFYMINPVTLAQMYGGANGDINPFLMTQILWKDQGSINRYGYIPQTIETQWFFDYAGVSARQNTANGIDNPIESLCNDLLARAVGIIHPLPLMGSATVTMPLRPDIMIGEKFSYVPFKDNITWMFYIEAVSHSFPFGGQPSTTLTLSRGLPASIYSNPTLLTAIYTGKAYKQNGTYVDSRASNTTYPGLTAVTLANAGSQETGFSNPQGGQQPST